MTKRMVAAIEHPLVDVIGHPTGRLIARREPYTIDIDRVIEAAARTGTFLEINANPNRRDLPDVEARAAAEAGVRMVVDSDAHGVGTLSNLRYGVATARRAWLDAPTRWATRARGPSWTRCASARAGPLSARPRRVTGSIFRSPGRRSSLGGPNGELPVEPELHAVAALDGGHGRRLLAPGSATSRE